MVLPAEGAWRSLEVDAEVEATLDAATAVLPMAIIACGERRLMQACHPLPHPPRTASTTATSPTQAVPVLARLLGCVRCSRVRAAAAVALLRLGWGVGLGGLSSAALGILEGMMGVPTHSAHLAQDPVLGARLPHPARPPRR